MTTASIKRGMPTDAPTPAELARASRNTHWKRMLLISPAMLLIGAFIVVPMGCLAVLSVIDESGASFTLNNYAIAFGEAATLQILWTTFRISIIVTLLCALLGYPVAYLLSQLPPRLAALCMLSVLLPFWTSILVRTYAWMVLLARNNLVNRGLQKIGVIDEPLRLLYNEIGTIIGMTHIMLPFLILPLYATARNIDRRYLHAAASLGCRPVVVFWRIFFPLSLPGFFAGLCFVFVLCLGFYITPELLGGGRVQMISMIIERSVTMYASWGPAAAIGVILLATTLLVLWLGWLLDRGSKGWA
ncbi:MAG: ABC transporter permease [Mesorhizobium sp.]|uniref:ABC transporter permease n=1 Tax=Mesorhizobium sp. TaxID=1871066 RepID=UPI0011FE81D7|nr:ABC transporter permease [Mesorhizobium sp.]TIR30055.1 MAG: ABC transporter permease [Mesorhizobium sp.]